MMKKALPLFLALLMLLSVPCALAEGASDESVAIRVDDEAITAGQLKSEIRLDMFRAALSCAELGYGYDIVNPLNISSEEDTVAFEMERQIVIQRQAEAFGVSELTAESQAAVEDKLQRVWAAYVAVVNSENGLAFLPAGDYQYVEGDPDGNILRYFASFGLTQDSLRSLLTRQQREKQLQAAVLADRHIVTEDDAIDVYTDWLLERYDETEIVRDDAVISWVISTLWDTDAAAPATWTCPVCGQTDNDDLFCPNCGTAKPEAASDPEPEQEIEVNLNLWQIPGETDRARVSILRIDGSAYVRGAKDRYLFEPAQAIDEDETTCWQVSAKKGGKNAPWLALIIEEETVDEIWIRNGCRTTDSKGKDQFPLYARLKDIRVELYMENDQKQDTLSFTLADQSDGWQKLDIGRHENVYDVWIYVESVYKGKSKPYNACLADLMLVQRAPAESALPPLD